MNALYCFLRRHGVTAFVIMILVLLASAAQPVFAQSISIDLGGGGSGEREYF